MAGLQDKVVVVTGAGAGIGRAVAVAAARGGARVAVCDLDEGSAKATVDAIAEFGATATTHQVDVSSEDEMRRLVDEVLGRHDVVDVVVNNAGIVLNPTPTLEVPLEKFRRVMDVNFWGVVYGSTFFLPHLLTRPEANLVNVASNAAVMAYTRMAPYCASKFAVRGFTETLRMELRRTSVSVTLVCPGATRTRIMANSPVMSAEARDAMQRQLDRAWARPPEAAAATILKAVKRNRPRAMLGPDTAVLDRLVRLFPGRYSQLLGGGIDKFLDKNIVGSGH